MTRKKKVRSMFAASGLSNHSSVKLMLTLTVSVDFECMSKLRSCAVDPFSSYLYKLQDPL